MSDHSFVSCHMGEEKPSLERTKIQYRKFKSIDYNAMKNDLRTFGKSCLVDDNLDTVH